MRTQLESRRIDATHYERAVILLEELVVLHAKAWAHNPKDLKLVPPPYGISLPLDHIESALCHEAIRALLDTGGFTAAYQEYSDRSFSHWTWLSAEPRAAMSFGPVYRLEGGPEDPLAP